MDGYGVLGEARAHHTGTTGTTGATGAWPYLGEAGHVHHNELGGLHGDLAQLIKGEFAILGCDVNVVQGP